MKAGCVTLTLTFMAIVLGPVSIAQTPQEHSNASAAIARPLWATPERLRQRVDPVSSIAIHVHLPLRNADAAKAELEAVSDPNSPRYGQYLSSEEFESKYSPSREDSAAVQRYLESEGFTVTHVPRNRLFVTATASAATVERVFATRLGLFEVKPGELRRAPIEAARIPPMIASRVSSVLGLRTARIKPMAIVGHASATPSQSSVPCPDYLGQDFDTTDPAYGDGYPDPTPIPACGLTPPRVRKAYGLEEAVAHRNDGGGVKVAIVDAWRSPTLVSDVKAYAAAVDPSHPFLDSQITLIDAPSAGDPTVPVDTGWYSEQAGDIEAVHAIAPGAHIVYVGAATNGFDDMLAALNLVVQDNLATLISNSYVSDIDDLGGPSDTEVQASDPIFVQAGLKGIGLYFASGDAGDNQCSPDCYIPQSAYATPGPAVLYPASSPYVTAVGGTSLYLDVNGLPAYETGWETGESILLGSGSNLAWTPSPPGLFFWGAGGGPSHRYPQPKWQRDIVPRSLAGATPMRVIPDLAMLADPDSGMQCGVTDPSTGTFAVYRNCGGTSLSTPLIAGTMALAEQRAGHRLGFANPLLYGVPRRVFRDIVPTPTPQAIAYPGYWTDTEDPSNLTVQRPDGTIVPHTLHSAPGFDDVTGRGVPAGEAFLRSVSARSDGCSDENQQTDCDH